ncbi:MAG: rRNA maturation RNase YbeY [Chlamydiales bacterium]
MKVFVFDEQSDLSIDPDSVQPIVSQVLVKEKYSTDEVSVHFVTTKMIVELHKKFFRDPSPTDCISFPIDQHQFLGSHVLGEIFICPRTGIEYILKKNSKDQNYYHEITLYLVHGLLHLIGYNDIGEHDRAKMRKAEQKLMTFLIRNQILLKG